MRLAVVTGTVVLAFAGPTVQQETWTFDNLTIIGGHRATIEGHPRVIDTPGGKAVQFNGVDDAIFIEVHPLAGAAAFTWEVVFRPDHDGRPEQRFFHLQERDPATGKDSQNRMLFETRLVEGQWFLDSFAYAGAASRALLSREHLHPLDAWYHVAMVYDGQEFRSYVNGALESAGELRWIPQGPGHTSAGVRINQRDYFKGAIRLARFTRRALAPAEFLTAPTATGGRSHGD